MKKEYHLTKTGIDELREEHDELCARRSEIAEKLQIARDYGDLAENAEYHSARDEQSALEIRVKEIEHILQNAKVINGNGKNGKVALGSEVVLKNGEGKKTYQLVGSVEANPVEGKISDESPIGQALLGKKIGDAVVISLPNGDVDYSVASIS